MMKTKFFVAVVTATMISTSMSAQSVSNDVIVLDLSKATTELTFNSNSGMWDGTFDDDETEIESQVFSFVHNSMGDYNTWWGFTASNSADNSERTNYVTYQYSNMAKGGIALNADGSIKTDSYGAVVTSADMPYLVAFAMTGFSKHPADMAFNTDKDYEVIGAYFNLNSYAYYSIMNGDGFARAFTNGDKFTLTVHGIGTDGSEKTVDVSLASYVNGNITINRGWMYVDLSTLGTVNQIWFSMSSTDSGAYGMNTPAYFCMDKLMVREAVSDGVSSTINPAKAKIRYDRANKTVWLEGADFAMVYDETGRCVMSSEGDSFSIGHLAAGVYIIKAGDAQIKIAR